MKEPFALLEYFPRSDVRFTGLEHGEAQPLPIDPYAAAFPSLLEFIPAHPVLHTGPIGGFPRNAVAVAVALSKSYPEDFVSSVRAAGYKGDAVLIQAAKEAEARPTLVYRYAISRYDFQDEQAEWGASIYPGMYDISTILTVIGPDGTKEHYGYKRPETAVLAANVAAMYRDTMIHPGHILYEAKRWEGVTGPQFFTMFCHSIMGAALEAIQTGLNFPFSRSHPAPHSRLAQIGSFISLYFAFNRVYPDFPNSPVKDCPPVIFKGTYWNGQFNQEEDAIEDFLRFVRESGRSPEFSPPTIKAGDTGKKESPNKFDYKRREVEAIAAFYEPDPAFLKTVLFATYQTWDTANWNKLEKALRREFKRGFKYRNFFPPIASNGLPDKVTSEQRDNIYRAMKAFCFMLKSPQESIGKVRVFDTQYIGAAIVGYAALSDELLPVVTTAPPDSYMNALPLLPFYTFNRVTVSQNEVSRFIGADVLLCTTAAQYRDALEAGNRLMGYATRVRQNTGAEAAYPLMAPPDKRKPNPKNLKLINFAGLHAITMYIESEGGEVDGVATLERDMQE